MLQIGTLIKVINYSNDLNGTIEIYSSKTLEDYM